MALTRVSRHIIDDPFNPTTVSATDVNGTNAKFTGIGTFGTLKVTGDLTVEGTTTTLDTELTSVDKLEVAANNNTVGAAITQSGTGDILNLFDGSTEVFTVTDGGKVGIEAPNPSGNLNISYLQVGKGQVSSDHSLYNYNTSFTNNAYQNGNGTFAHITSRAVGVINIQDNVLTFSNGPGGTAGQSATLTERLRITSDGKIGIGNTISSALLTIGGNSDEVTTPSIRLLDGSDSREVSITNTSGDFIVSTHGTDDAIHGRIKIFESGVIDLDTGGSGGTLTNRLRITTGGQVRVPDGGKFTCGASDDLQIFHGSNLSYVVNYTGELLLVNHTDDSDISIHSDNGSGGTTPYFRADGSTGDAILYHYGTEKLATKSTGIQVTGQVNASTMHLTDGNGIHIGNGNDLRVYHNGTNSYIENYTGNLYLFTASNDKDIILQSDNGSGGLANYIVCDGSEGSVILSHLGNTRIQTTNTGASVTGNLNISGHTYLNDNRELVIGAGNDLKLYHNATNSYIDNATGDLWIRADGDDLNLRAADNISLLVQNNHNGINVYGEGPVDLYHNNIHRFQTTATGAKVFGALEVTQEYPTIRPTLDLNFAATKTLDRRITFTRDSLGTYVGEDGLVKYASNNVPRFDHDPATGESLGLLVEESRTNDFAHSDPANAAWVGDNGAIKTANTTDTAAPDGSFTALKLASQANANSYSQIYDNLSKSSGGIQSLWAKKGTHNVIGIYDYSGSAGIRGWFDLNTGEHRCEGGSKVAAGVQSNGNDNNNTNMVEYPNGWYRCIYYEAANMTYAHLRICDFDSDAEASSSSNTIYLWGLQAELNKTFATSFIPSLSGTMPATNSTREVDNFKISGTNFESFINKTEGTMMMEYKNLSSAVNTGLPTIGDGTHSRYMMFNLGTDTQFSAATVNGGVVQANPSVNITSSSSQFAKAIYAVKENDFAITANGQTPVTDTSGTLFTTPTQFTLEYGAGGNDPNAHFKSIKYYPKRLPNAQLQGLTQQ